MFTMSLIDKLAILLQFRLLHAQQNMQEPQNAQKFEENLTTSAMKCASAESADLHSKCNQTMAMVSLHFESLEFM